jgi:hypothetical protein
MTGIAMAMHDEGTASERAEPGRKKQVSPARDAIGLVLLVAFSAVAFLEWDANRRSNAGIAELNEALAKEEGDLLSMEGEEGLLGRGPDGPGVPEGRELRVTYTWMGVFRKCPVVAVYKGGDRPALLRIE